MASAARAPPSVCSHQILFFDALVIGVFGLLHALLTDALVAAGFLFTGARAVLCARESRDSVRIRTLGWLVPAPAFAASVAVMPA